jgi:hypothetical protein
MEHADRLRKCRKLQMHRTRPAGASARRPRRGDRSVLSSWVWWCPISMLSMQHRSLRARRGRRLRLGGVRARWARLVGLVDAAQLLEVAGQDLHVGDERVHYRRPGRVPAASPARHSGTGGSLRGAAQRGVPDRCLEAGHGGHGASGRAVSILEVRRRHRQQLGLLGLRQPRARRHIGWRIGRHIGRRIGWG